MTLKLSLLTTLILCFGAGIAQILPNQSFENWTSDGEFENPNGWDCSNRSFFSIISFNPVTKDTTDAFDGLYSARLETIQESTGEEFVKMLGVLTLGSFDVDIITRTAKISGGISFNQRPTALTGYFKYLPFENDSCDIRIGLTRYNNSTQTADTIGQGRFTAGMTSEWTKFVVPVEYSSSLDPDTLNIVFLSSDTSIFNVGSILWIDSVSLDGVNGINEIMPDKFSIYPIPADNYLIINTFSDKNIKKECRFYSMKGELIQDIQFAGISKEIDLSVFPSGTYLLEYYEDHKPAGTTKIIINKP